jgi:hypothetical protein
VHEGASSISNSTEGWSKASAANDEAAGSEASSGRNPTGGHRPLLSSARGSSTLGIEVPEAPLSAKELQELASKIFSMAELDPGDEAKGLADLKRLEPGCLLNDIVINTYLELISEYSKGSIYVFSTFFYTKLVGNGAEHVQRWTAGTDIFKHRLIYIPVHLPMHWTFVVIDVPKLRIEYYDSLGGKGRHVLYNIRRYYRAEWKRVHRSDINLQVLLRRHIPRQENGVDCGAFVCMYARCRMEQIQWVRASGMNTVRQMMLHEILAGRILYPSSYYRECEVEQGDIPHRS